MRSGRDLERKGVGEGEVTGRLSGASRRREGGREGGERETGRRLLAGRRGGNDATWLDVKPGKSQRAFLARHGLLRAEKHGRFEQVADASGARTCLVRLGQAAGPTRRRRA